MKLFRLFMNLFLLIPASAGFTGCQKLLDPGLPSTRVVATIVYNNDSLATKALIGIYSTIMEAFGPLNGQMTRYGGFCADELDRTTLLDQDQPFLNNALVKEDATVKTFWQACYTYIYAANDLIQGVEASPFPAPARNQISAEARFLRALTYFYLVNTFGAVPLILTTDYITNAVMPRTQVEKIYDQIISDLEDAKNILPMAYVARAAYPNERIRANKMAAAALLARVYLFRGLWAKAAATATEVIQSSAYQLEQNLQQAFMYNSREAILQFQPVSAAYNTAEAGMFVPISPAGKPSITLTTAFLQRMEPDDARSSWIRTVTISGKTYHSPYKFKVNQGPPYTEYSMVLRLAEQYLIRAEARAWQGKLFESAVDLNIIRARAKLTDRPPFETQEAALTAVEQERCIELFSEWGHRWLDLKRWPSKKNQAAITRARIDDVMEIQKPAAWQSTDKLWPIPGDELLLNPYLTQNPGY